MNTEMTQKVVQVAEQTANLAAAPESQSFIEALAQFMNDGGVFMWFIFAVWCFGIAIAIERIKTLISYDTNGNGLMGVVKKHVLLNEVHTAIESCSNTKSLLAGVISSGLKRSNQQKEQIQDALESSILESIPKVEKRLNYLALVANVSTLIGLLGTIYGLIESFAAVASADPSEKAKLLAMGISKAMNTTALGLISAISIMVVHTILTSKAEKIISELEQYSTKLLDLLGTRKPATAKAVESNDAA
jgi:biopolymer transport protein ExbB/TolQ